MAKYRQRPVIVEATQFSRAEHFDGKNVTLAGVETLLQGGDRVFFIRTRDGMRSVATGDWVVRAHGEVFPCRPDVFEATYERVMRPGEIGDEDGQNIGAAG